MVDGFKTSQDSDAQNAELGFAVYALILYNDEVNSFDYVTESLVEVCEHDSLQAEQCTYLTHFKGSCDVKLGEAEYLRPYRTRLVDRGLNVSIEKVD